MHNQLNTGDSLYQILSELFRPEDYNINSIIYLLKEIGINLVNKDRLNRKLFKHYIQLLDAKSKSLNKVLFCFDQIYYCDVKICQTIFAKIQGRYQLPDSYTKQAMASLECIYRNKKLIIENFNRIASRTIKSDLQKKMSVYLKKNHAPTISQQVLSLFNYEGDSKVRSELPQLIEKAYLHFLCMMNESYKYSGHERKVIATLTNMLINVAKYPQTFDRPTMGHLLKVDIDIIQKSIMSTLIRQVIYHGKYDIFSQNIQYVSPAILNRSEETLAKKNHIISEHLCKLFIDVFSELKNEPSRFGLVKLPEIDILRSQRYLDRQASWESASNVIAYILSCYHAITPLTLSAAEFIEFIAYVKQADEKFSIGVEHDNSVTPLSIIAYSTDCRFLSLYHCEQDEEFNRKIRSLFTFDELIALLPKPEILKFAELSDKTIGLFIIPIRKIVDRLILIRNASEDYMNQLVNVIVKIMIQRYISVSYQSIFNVMNFIKIIVFQVNLYRYNYKLKEQKKIQLSEELKNILQLKINTICRKKADADLLNGLLNDIFYFNN